MTIVIALGALLAQAPDPVAQPMADQVERLHREADRIRDEVRAKINADEIRREVLRSVDGARIAAQVSAELARSGVHWEGGKKAMGSSAYRSGVRALDDRKWDEAIDAFKRSDKYKPDAALYWTAFAHFKAGRAEPALQALGTLKSQYASSPWRNDGQTLEVEIKAAQGKPVNPDSVADDEIKLIAISGLVRSDAEKALPHLEKLVTTSQSPRVKEEALNMLARTNSPRARDLIVRVARSGNPDMQRGAIHALGRMEPKDSSALLTQLYNEASTKEAKEEALDALSSQRAVQPIIAIAKAEKNLELKKRAVRYLSRMNSKEANDYLAELLK